MNAGATENFLRSKKMFPNPYPSKQLHVTA